MNIENELKIDNIYWERIQLFIEGHVNKLKLTNKSILLKNKNSHKYIFPNELIVSGNEFKARFNIAISDKGNYIPKGSYLIVYKSKSEFTATISNNLINQKRHKLTGNEFQYYNNLNNEQKKNNYLLGFYKHYFKKSPSKFETYYVVEPKVTENSKELTIDINFKFPSKRKEKNHRKIGYLKKPIRRIMYEIRVAIFNLIFRISKYMNFKKGKTVLFTSDSRSSRTGNFEYIYNEMIKRKLNHKYNISEMYKSDISSRRNLIDKFKLPYLLAKADYIFVDDYHPLIYDLKFRNNQEIIQVWHAVGSFKTVGYSRTGMKDGPFFNSSNHRNYTKVFVSSENDIIFYAEAFGVKEQNIIPTGVPRTDILFDRNYKNKVIEEIKNEVPIQGKKVILFAPTFRGSGHLTAYYPDNNIDYKNLAEYCKNKNAIVLLKMHPFVKNNIKIPEEYKEYFIDISNYREVNKFLFVTDILISDYSSLIYEYALFEKPMIFYAFDLEEYSNDRGFYEDYEKIVPGKIVYSFSELMNSLWNNDFEIEKVPEFLDKTFKYQDGKSSERVVIETFGKD
ncbi:CDP-glycerol glycerophosphotransferase family protein [Mammaliicoccus sciuri]|uniref:CDP-glycerol glycerophosphotransferase family protein n=1 Tax=Mammaliicoccus sciuri TaxID=1296 RepID=UPI0008F62FB1|nr:Hypothetical protein SSCIU_00226 [Mammaliicoccus sciuri]